MTKVLFPQIFRQIVMPATTSSYSPAFQPSSFQGGQACAKRNSNASSKHSGFFKGVRIAKGKTACILLPESSTTPSQ
jgi:hypothetical protein